jgi:hypothetical protein
MAATKPSPGKNTARKGDFAKEMLESMPFQRREWLIQRVGWVLIALVLLAGLLGLLGRGPLGQRTSVNAALQVEYEWLARRDAQTTWTLTPLQPPVDGRHRVALDANWARHFHIHSIHPEPQSAQLAEGHWVYEFEAREMRELPIVFHVEARKMGRLEGSVVFNDAPPLQIAVFVYP